MILLSPLLAVTALAVWWALGSPILFYQVRPGLHGVPFTIYKFRSMRELHDARGKQLPAAERLTRFGRFLRSTSVDELPELFNVLRGDMSLVGPRPLMLRYLARYTVEQARRHAVKPGITGWAQVHGRNALSWEQRFAYDLWYVDHHNMLVDLKILAMTVLLVLRRKAVTPPGREIMEEFRGYTGVEHV